MDAATAIRRSQSDRASLPVVGYLASLDARRTVLWSAFLWYLAMAFRYGEFEPSVWQHSVGIAVVVGVILTLNAAPPRGRVRDLGLWAVLRFFLIPFCVASFSAFARGHAFVLIFPAKLAENIVAGSLIAVFCVLVWLAKRGQAGGTRFPTSAAKSGTP